MSTVSKPSRKPGYKLHKATGQARVIINGHHYYLGQYGSDKSWAKYHRLIRKHLENKPGKRRRRRSHERCSIVRLAAAYYKHAKSYYVKNGEATDHLYRVKRALRALKVLYGSDQASDFGPKRLKRVQRYFISRNLSRSYINDLVVVIKQCFKWAVSEEIVRSPVYDDLTKVAGLGKGRTKARETARILPVPDGTVDATLPFLPPVVAAMVKFQQLTGCRPCELCILRPCDVDQSGDVWRYVPSTHKNEHHGLWRVIFIGPRAQQILAPFLERAAEAYCFCPQESEAQRRQLAHAQRETPDGQGNSPGTNRKASPKRRPGARYTKDSYRRAILRGCMRANVQLVQQTAAAPHCVQLLPCWRPNQLRHSFATKARKQFNIDSARALLGHTDTKTTEIYAEAEADAEKAAAAVREMG